MLLGCGCDRRGMGQCAPGASLQLPPAGWSGGSQALCVADTAEGLLRNPAPWSTAPPTPQGVIPTLAPGVANTYTLSQGATAAPANYRNPMFPNEWGAIAQPAYGTAAPATVQPGVQTSQTGVKYTGSPSPAYTPPPVAKTNYTPLTKLDTTQPTNPVSGTTLGQPPQTPETPAAPTDAAPGSFDFSTFLSQYGLWIAGGLGGIILLSQMSKRL